MNYLKKILSIVLSCLIPLVSFPGGLSFAQGEPSSSTPVVSAQPSGQELQQLVAPIALYPDSLVAQVLAAATYPEEVVEADRWLQAHPDLKGDQLGQAVDEQNWDPSVKALTEFPSVLANMDKNLSWTTSLGEAYINNQQGVMDAVQQMRESAKQAGHLNSTPQIKVIEEPQTIVIEPADPEIVYVPEYDPWLVYGVPVVPWPGWYWYPGLYWTSPGIGFGVGFGIGFFGGFGWGWHHWHSDWHHHDVEFDHHHFESHSRTVINHNYYANREHANNFHNGRGDFHGGNGFHGGNDFHGRNDSHGGNDFHGSNDFHGGSVPQHSYAAPHSPAEGRSGAFGGMNHGGQTRSYSSRGSSSMGGFHGGGGGFHGGGGGHGGHR